MRPLTLLLLSAGLAWPGVLNGIVSLPNQPTVTAIQRDASGNLYLAGYVAAANPRTFYDCDAFVAKLSGDGGTVLFWTLFSGSGFEEATALTLAPDGSIMTTGFTFSSDFPVTAGAAQPVNTAPTRGDTFRVQKQIVTVSGPHTGFFARLDANGKVVYASYLNGPATALQPPSPMAIATDATGAAYITGPGVFPSTTGALAAPINLSAGYFVTKLDATGKTVFTTGGIGGLKVALDSQGSLYLAGSQQPSFSLPVTAGAFQSTIVSSVCGGVTGGPSLGGGPIPCSHQYVAKLDPTGGKLIYATWLSGSYGAQPAGLSVDSAGNATLAGTTQSSDYPVTAGALQTTDYATAPAAGNLESQSILPIKIIPAPPPTGYVTRLNATGAGLVFSTFLGGSGEDSIFAQAVDSAGNTYVAGLAQSPDLPGLVPMPAPCLPSFPYPVPFVTRLSADGSALSETQLAYGLTFNQHVPPELQTLLAGLDGHGKAAVLSETVLASLDLFSATPPLACVVDAADLAPLTQIAPGQLLSLFGEGIGADPGTAAPAQNGRLPTTLNGVAVALNGVPAPILYASRNQLNVQAPYEISGKSSAHLAISNGAPAGTRDFGVVAMQPSVFVNPGYTTCGTTITNLLLPVAVNPDGTLNGCGNPAAPGSTLTLFVNGLGLAGGALQTGAIAAAPASQFSLPVGTGGGGSIVFESVPGVVNGVWAVGVNLGQGQPQSSGVSLVQISLTIGGVGVPESLVVWIKVVP